jgi:hypothetical protein
VLPYGLRFVVCYHQVAVMERSTRYSDGSLLIHRYEKMTPDKRPQDLTLRLRAPLRDRRATTCAWRPSLSPTWSRSATAPTSTAFAMSR